jgi:polyisoprenoid-binding protein YceI
MRPFVQSALVLLFSSFTSMQALASDYVIDTEGAHAFIQFKISHLGYSWLVGRFNRFSGEFSYDENDPASAHIEVRIETASIDSNHAERDKHLRDEDILDVERYPEARFVSTSYAERADGSGLLRGDLTLHGVTRQIEIDIKQVGAGSDPWGGYRRGFEGSTRITLADFGITKFLGNAAREMTFSLGIEGVRQKTDNRHRRPGGLRIQ